MLTCMTKERSQLQALLFGYVGLMNLLLNQPTNNKPPTGFNFKLFSQEIISALTILGQKIKKLVCAVESCKAVSFV